MKNLYLTGLFIIYLVANVCAQASESIFLQKAEIVINKTADVYNPPSQNIGDPEKYYWPIVIARFEKYGVNDSVANHWVRTFAKNPPFHFTLVGMARILYNYGDAPAVIENRELILKEVFGRNDSYNAFTGEGTENHVAMSRTSGYLYAQSALENNDIPDAHKKLAEMDQWLKYWSKRIYQVGTGEWNSSTYLAYSVLSWLNVYDFATDEKIKDVAKAVLDYYASELALHYSFGSIGGSEMRGGNSSHNTATSYLGWLWFGDIDDYYGIENGLTGSQYIQCIHAATSKYRPPLALIKLAQKKLDSPVYFKNSQPAYLLEEASFVKEFFYIDPNFTLGSTVSSYGGYTGSTSQIVPWKLVVRQEAGKLPMEISGNGMYYSGLPVKGRDPYTQVVQHKNILIQMTSVPTDEEHKFAEVKNIVTQWANDWQLDFNKRFPGETHKSNIVNYREKRSGENKSYIVFPKEILIDSVENVVLVDAGNAVITVRSLNHTKPRIIRSKGSIYFIDEAPMGKICGFIMETVSKSTYHDYKKVLNKNSNFQVKEHKVSFTTIGGERIDAQFMSDGTFTEAISDWGYGKTKPHPMLTSPPLRQPTWPSGKGWGKVPEITINKKKIDLGNEWPVWQAPLLNLNKSILTITDGVNTYRVKYNEELPEFEISEVFK